ncbi:MAG: hypothetical protein NTZ73_04745 [Candidatus Diapherotrites archaeon]|nr:hypothetical protein [Candidatus Diapherotrites archaeon]
MGINSKPLARTLYLCGVPVGAKVSQDFLIPNWIIEEKIFFRAFIRAYFSCEANVEQTKSIMLEQWKLSENLQSGAKFMKQIVFLLDEYFGIKVLGPYFPKQRNKRKKGITRAVRIKIRKHADFLKYVNIVGFCDANKQNRAIFILSRY